MITASDLTRKVQIRKQTDVANGSLGIDQTFDTGIPAWAKVQPVSGGMFFGAEQVGQDITHRFWIRYSLATKPALLDEQHVIDWDGRRYRIRRASDFNDKNRFVMIEATDLGAIP